MIIHLYKRNANMTSDKNRGITDISYNILNLPEHILFDSGKYTNLTYSATGEKIRADYQVKLPVIHYPKLAQMAAVSGGITIPPINDSLIYKGDIDTTASKGFLYTYGMHRMDYSGNIIYYDFEPERVLFDGGYVTFVNNRPAYHFYLTDHQGNVRIVASAGGDVEETNHYYPFGALFGESAGGGKQRYKYNGKELDRLLALDWYDYGARWYDPVLARWHAIDPLCEKYYDISPYVYCNNNAVNAVDIKGLFPHFLISHKSTPFYRADYYILNPATCRLLSLVSGVSEKYIRNAQIIQRGFGHYYPLYSPNKGGGAITLGNTPDNVSINFTPNYFEDNKEKYNGHGYGQNFSNWMALLSHEVGHIKHIKESGNEALYIGSFLYDYIEYGHDETPREKEADNGYNKFMEFYDYTNKSYGKYSLDKLFKSDKTDKQKIKIIDQWWNEYENEMHMSDICY